MNLIISSKQKIAEKWKNGSPSVETMKNLWRPKWKFIPCKPRVQAELYPIAKCNNLPILPPHTHTQIQRTHKFPSKIPSSGSISGRKQKENSGGAACAQVFLFKSLLRLSSDRQQNPDRLRVDFGSMRNLSSAPRHSSPPLSLAPKQVRQYIQTRMDACRAQHSEKLSLLGPAGLFPKSLKFNLSGTGTVQAIIQLQVCSSARAQLTWPLLLVAYPSARIQKYIWNAQQQLSILFAGSKKRASLSRMDR